MKLGGVCHPGVYYSSLKVHSVLVSSIIFFLADRPTTARSPYFQKGNRDKDSSMALEIIACDVSDERGDSAKNEGFADNQRSADKEGFADNDGFAESKGTAESEAFAAGEGFTENKGLAETATNVGPVEIRNW
jgi:hypothetical protein